MAVVDRGPVQLVSRNRHAFASFAGLADGITASLPSVGHAVLDGEIICLDPSGKPQFRGLLFRRDDPCFFAFDLFVQRPGLAV